MNVLESARVHEDGFGRVAFDLRGWWVAEEAPEVVPPWINGAGVRALLEIKVARAVRRARRRPSQS